MSWYANTVLPTMESVFANAEPPSSPEAAAMKLKEAGRMDVANYIIRQSHEAYENIVWEAHLRAIEVGRPLASDDEEDFTEEECP